MNLYCQFHASRQMISNYISKSIGSSFKTENNEPSKIDIDEKRLISSTKACVRMCIRTIPIDVDARVKNIAST